MFPLTPNKLINQFHTNLYTGGLGSKIYGAYITSLAIYKFS